jgi:hypothetical protein
LLLSLALWAGLPSAVADKIYKSVDADGKVTYSSRPPVDATESRPVTPPQEPSESDRQAAMQRASQTGQAVEHLDQERQQRQEQSRRRVDEATQQVNDARAKAKEAGVQRDEDWQTMAKGGRYLKDGYYRRVDQARQALEQAEKNLGNADRDR